MFNAPSFVSANIPNPNLGPEKDFSLGPGRAPIPAKLVLRILSDKFIELTELLPENLDEPLSDTTSFAIEGSISSQCLDPRKKVKLGHFVVG
jgi:hypothetical protein